MHDRVTIALLDALLRHHSACQKRLHSDEADLPHWLISYKDLCILAGFPGYQRAIGHRLAKIAAWCDENNHRPINSLVINKKFGRPGDNYGLALGCSNENWRYEAVLSIQHKVYPAAYP